MGFKNLKNLILVFSNLMLVLISSLALTSCGANNVTNGKTGSSAESKTVIGSSMTDSNLTFQNADLNGAGATFPAPLYTKWFDTYNKLTGVKINYQAVGSGTGIQQITSKTVDFGASDAIMTDDQQYLAEAENGPILHIPMTSGAVAIIYNVNGIASGQLKLDGEVLANIYLKNILKWNDPSIVSLNPGLPLPNAPIAVVHRSDGSGTTYIFTNYLSKTSAEWSSKIGFATSVSWVGDIGGAQSAGIAAQVQQIPDSIGYVELAYAEENNIPMALIKNASGNYEEPSLQGVTKAMEGVDLPDDMKVMITNSANPDAYPICGFTWILAYVNQLDQTKGETLAKMLWWAVQDGQQYDSALDYAPLSNASAAKAENEILKMNYKGAQFITK